MSGALRSATDAIAQRFPVLERVRNAVRGRPAAPRFTSSSDYWEKRYRDGADSGPGSYGRLAQFKAGFLNDFVAANDVRSLIELGCGDGNQLSLAAYPRYLGVDVAAEAVRICSERFEDDPSKSFCTLEELPAGETAELALSLDVIFHLVEDDVFHAHVRRLFASATRFVIIYTSDGDPPLPYRPAPHVRHRTVAAISDLAPSWELVQRVPNPYPFEDGDPDTSFANFFVFAPRTA